MTVNSKQCQASRSGSGLNLEFSAHPRRSLRLSGEWIERLIHRRDAEVAEITQRKTQFRTLATTDKPAWLAAAGRHPWWRRATAADYLSASMSALSISDEQLN